MEVLVACADPCVDLIHDGILGSGVEWAEQLVSGRGGARVGFGVTDCG